MACVPMKTSDVIAEGLKQLEKEYRMGYRSNVAYLVYLIRRRSMTNSKCSIS